MSLAEKMFDRVTPGCGFRSECRSKSNRKFFGDLFAEDWVALVIRHDEDKGKYNWFTLCCEKVNAICNAKSKTITAACC